MFKQKIIQQCKALPSSSDLEDLIHCAEATSAEEEDDAIRALGNVVDFYIYIKFISIFDSFIY